jgi:hypothetical protein
MSSTIKYKNTFGTTISFNQVKTLNRYYIINCENGAVKTIISVDKYSGIEKKGISYYMGISEVKNDVLQNLKQFNSYHYFVLFYNKQNAYGVDLWDFEEYKENLTLNGKGKKAYDGKHRVVMSCGLDLQTNQPKGNFIYKKYYGNQFGNESEDLLIKVEYYENGNVDWIYDSNENFGYSDPISLQEFLADTEFSQQDFPWNQHPYYHSIYPFLPEGPL